MSMVETQVLSTGERSRIRRFVDDVLSNEGATATIDGGSAPSFGFMVSVAGAETKIPEGLFRSHGQDAVRRFERRNDGLLTRDGAYVGAWVHEGFVFLDVSYWFADEAVARLQGEAEKQLAIFDLANMCEIAL